MFSVKRSRTVPHSAAKMYDLVNDVLAYPTFLPGCKDAKVLRLDGHTQEAWIQFEKGPLKQAWITRNTLIPGKRIEMQLVEGPFRRLQGIWQFASLLPNGCEITLNLEAEPKYPFLKWVFPIILKELADHMVQAFCQRAERIYGRQDERCRSDSALAQNPTINH